MTDTYLKHFGVLGMRWGHRQYVTSDGNLTAEGKQKYSGTTLEKDLINSRDRKIKKGTTIQNISDKELPTTLRSGLYSSYTKYDNSLYGVMMGNYMYDNNSYKNTFVTKKNIKVPSDKKTVEILLKTIKENPDEFIKDMTKVSNEMKVILPTFEFMMRRKVSALNLNDPEGIKEQKLAKKFLTEALMSRKASNARNRFYANVVKAGYDAVSDSNDRDQTTQDPLVIVNTKSIKSVGGSVKLTSKDIQNYLAYSITKEHTSRERDLSEVQR